MRRFVCPAGIAAAAILVYLGIVGYFYVKQRDFQYDREGKVYSLNETVLQRAEVVSIKTADGSSLLGWYAPPTGDLPTILYFRGKTGSFTREYERFEAYEAAGYGFLSFDYRGFPGSPGEVTETNALADSLAASTGCSPGYLAS